MVEDWTEGGKEIRNLGPKKRTSELTDIAKRDFKTSSTSMTHGGASRLYISTSSATCDELRLRLVFELVRLAQLFWPPLKGGPSGSCSLFAFV